MSKRHKPEEIIAKLRQVDVMTAQGTTVVDAVRSIGVTEVTYYRWRQEYGGLTTDQVRPDEGVGTREPAAQEGGGRPQAAVPMMAMRAPMTLPDATNISLVCTLVLTIPALAFISSAQASCPVGISLLLRWFNKARARQRCTLPRPRPNVPFSEALPRCAMRQRSSGYGS